MVRMTPAEPNMSGESFTDIRVDQQPLLQTELSLYMHFLYFLIIAIDFLVYSFFDSTTH